MNDFFSFVLSFNKYLLNVYCMLSTGLRAGKATVNKTDQDPTSRGLNWNVYISKEGKIMLGKKYTIISYHYLFNFLV